MLTEKEKKIGIIMLILSAVAVIALIVVKVVTSGNGGIHGSGVGNGEENAKVVPVKTISTIFYDTTLGEVRYDCSLSKPATLGVYYDLVREAEGALAVQDYVQQQEAQQALRETRTMSADFVDLGSRMTSEAYATQRATLQGNSLPVDSKSLTSLGVNLDTVVSQGELAMANVFYNNSFLDKVRAIPEGSLAEGNSINSLYTECIVPNYTEGTYVAYRVTEDSMELLGGDELLCLLLSGVSTDKVAEYKENGETLESLVEKGEVSTEVGVQGGTATVSVYEACGINYSKYYVDTLGATEELLIVHLVDDSVVVENYAVGNLYGTDYVNEGMTDEVAEEGGDSEEMTAPDVVETTVPIFTGYYCW